MIAALYVQRGGCYWDLPGVDPWDEARDARLYDGPWPVVAHPPCERWGYFRHGSPVMIARGVRLTPGDDGGCFAAALASVRKWSGVLEHPEHSFAWERFGLKKPPKAGGWVSADFVGGWTCRVEQAAFGHLSRKPTWLYAHGVELPSLPWGKTDGAFQHLRRTSARRHAERGYTFEPTREPPRKAAAATPAAFRDLLISIAETAHPQSEAA